MNRFEYEPTQSDERELNKAIRQRDDAIRTATRYRQLSVVLGVLVGLQIIASFARVFL